MTPLDYVLHKPTGESCRIVSLWTVRGYRMATVQFNGGRRRTMRAALLDRRYSAEERRLAKSLGLKPREVREARAC